MFIKCGFQREFGKVKFDVGQDEVDLARILAEAGISPDAQLTSREAFEVLRLSTEQLCLRQLAYVAPAEAEDCKAEFKKLEDQFHGWLTKITVRLDLQPDGDA